MLEAALKHMEEKKAKARRAEADALEQALVVCDLRGNVDRREKIVAVYRLAARRKLVLADVLYWIDNHVKFIQALPCEKCDPADEAVEVWSELAVMIRSVLEG